MKQQRIRFKSRKKFTDRFNAQYKKLTAGFMTRPQAATDRSKQHKGSHAAGSIRGKGKKSK